MNKDGTLVINNWQEGIGRSPVEGFGDMRNVEIHQPRGTLKIALAPSKISGTTVTGLPTWATSRTESDHYFGGYQDTNVYAISISTVSSVSGGSITGGTTGGAWFKDYLVVTDYDTNGDGKLDAYEPVGQTWTNNFADTAQIWDEAASKVTTPMLWSQDDILYGGTGRYVWTLTESTDFDPSSGSTFSFNGTALDLPEDYYIESLADLGSDLRIGASILRGGIKFEGRNGRIYPWDRTSSSFSLPTQLNDGGVRQMISTNGLLYFENGRHGRYFVSNGTTTQELPTIGTLRNNPTQADGEIFPEAKAVVNGEFLFGVSTNDTLFTPAGVYGFKDGAWRFLEISTGEIGENGDLEIGVIHKKDNNKFFVGWYDAQNSAYGIDEFGFNSYRYTGYKARVDSQIYQVGTSNNPKSTSMVEVVLEKALVADQGVRISYRKDNESSFTVLTTVDFDTYGATTGESVRAGFHEAKTVQIRVELTTGTNATNTPEVREIRLW